MNSALYSYLKSFFLYAKLVWIWLALGWVMLLFSPALPFVGLGQAGALLVGCGIIAELYFSRTHSKWSKMVELGVARALDCVPIWEVRENAAPYIGGALIDRNTFNGQGNIHHSYATIESLLNQSDVNIFYSLVRQEDYYTGIILQYDDPSVKPWNYHKTLDRINGKIEFFIASSIFVGTLVWAFGDQFADWVKCA